MWYVWMQSMTRYSIILLCINWIMFHFFSNALKNVHFVNGWNSWNNTKFEEKKNEDESYDTDIILNFQETKFKRHNSLNGRTHALNKRLFFGIVFFWSKIMKIARLTTLVPLFFSRYFSFTLIQCMRDTRKTKLFLLSAVNNKLDGHKDSPFLQ